MADGSGLAKRESELLRSEVTSFTKNKSRVVKGAKEAKWNNKYMKIIENPVKQIEQASELLDIQMVIIALLRSLHNIYNNSNFYKEARIVSFVDRLMETIKTKMQAKMNLQASVYQGMRNYESYLKELSHGRNIVTKFIDNFFIKDLMNKSKLEDMGYPTEEKKYDENSDLQQKMGESFYRKEGLDFLYFQRPGTAYNNPAAFGKDSTAVNMMGTATRS